MNQLNNISDLSISKNDIYWLSHKILSSRKVLILGHSSVLGSSFTLQSLLLYFNKLVYVPYNYSSQIQLINEMNESDLIITHNLSSDWMDSSIVDACKFELKDINSSCVSISISTDSIKSNKQINYSRIIQLSKKESLLSESIFSLFYKLVTIYCFFLLSGEEESEDDQENISHISNSEI